MSAGGWPSPLSDAIYIDGLNYKKSTSNGPPQMIASIDGDTFDVMGHQEFTGRYVRLFVVPEMAA